MRNTASWHTYHPHILPSCLFGSFSFPSVLPPRCSVLPIAYAISLLTMLCSLGAEVCIYISHCIDFFHLILFGWMCIRMSPYHVTTYHFCQSFGDIPKILGHHTLYTRGNSHT